MRHLIGLLVLTSIVGCGGSPATAMHVYPSPPSASLLCQLVPHQSTSADVQRVLGQPDSDQTQPDRSATSSYYYDDPRPGPTVSFALIQFWFTSDARFDNATVANIDMPACWSTDGGS